MGGRRTIHGRFELGDFIAQGGMGAVYRGVDTETGQSVAIKRLKPGVTLDNPAALQRFAREGEILRCLDHPNIVKMLAALPDGGEQYIVMEYVAGGSLRELLAREGQLSIARAAGIVLELSDALSRAHHLKVVHRDIKPENVLLAEDGTPRLSDFGAARMGERHLTPTHALIGTLGYLSPEAFLGLEVDERADIWALGVMLFEMLIGHPPFQSDHHGGLIAAILHVPVPDMEAACPNAPVALIDLIYRMLAKDRSERIPSARQVGAELEAILKELDLGVAARSGLRPPRQAKLNANVTHAATPVVATLEGRGTPFVGREAELAELSALLADPKVRLVTILGPGGMGKSRLALEAGHRWSSDARRETWADGEQRRRAYFVELAPIGSADLIVPRLAEAVGFHFYPGGDARRQLLDYFRDKSLLLLMDNFEHVLAGASLIHELLEAAPGVKVIATSRERLGLLAENAFVLSGMRLPPSEGAADPLGFSSVQLFVESARRALLGFELGPAQAPRVARICRLVQGMPLGIVLAASWVSVLTPEEIADEIAKDVDFLQTELSGVHSRQQSIRVVFDHSWALLGADERALFARVSVFRGGFTRAAAEAVAHAKLRTLAALINKSLLRREPKTGRYEVHELLRQYAESKLKETDSEHASAHECHADYYARFLARREADIRGVDQRRALQEIDDELDNVRAAWRWMLERKQLELVGMAIEGLRLFYQRRGSREEAEQAFSGVHGAFASEAERDTPPARRIIGLALSLQGLFAEEQGRNLEAGELVARALEILDPKSEPRERAFALMTAALTSLNRARTAAQTVTFAEQSVALYRTTGDGFGLAEALVLLGRIYIHSRGDFVKAEASFKESVAIQQAFAEAAVVMPSSLAGLGNAQAMQGQQAEGCRLIAEALAIAEAYNDVGSRHICLRMLANARRTLGDYAAAEAAILQSSSLARECGNRDSQAWCCLSLGDIQKEQGRLDEAVTSYQAGLAFGAQDGMKRSLAQLNLGDVALMRGQYADARAYLSQSLVGFETIQVRWGLVIALDNLGYMECHEGNYREASAHFWRAFDIALTDHTLSLLNNVVAGLALLHLRVDQPRRAAELLGLAKHHPTTERQTHTRRLEPLLFELRGRLAPADLAAALEVGKAIDPAALRTLGYGGPV